MVNEEIDINSNSVDKLDIDLLYVFNKPSLIDMLLERMEV